MSARPDSRGDQPMSTHMAISPKEAADRLAIRELVEAYAHCADRRDAKGQMALFTEDPTSWCIWTARIRLHLRT